MYTRRKISLSLSFHRKIGRTEEKWKGQRVQEKNRFSLGYIRNLGYDNTFFIISYDNQKYKLTFVILEKQMSQ
jgi:hypothetical protein